MVRDGKFKAQSVIITDAGLSHSVDDLTIWSYQQFIFMQQSVETTLSLLRAEKVRREGGFRQTVHIVLTLQVATWIFRVHLTVDIRNLKTRNTPSERTAMFNQLKIKISELW